MYCLLNYLFFILSLLDNTDWLAKFKRYRVYVSQEDQHAMPENTLGYYRPGTGRWGVHIIRVKANLPKNLKITVLCHQCAHFIEYVSNNSEHKKDRTELEVHNSEWKAIYSELLYSFYTSGLLNPDKDGKNKSYQAYVLHHHNHTTLLSHTEGFCNSPSFSQEGQPPTISIGYNRLPSTFT